MNIDMDETSPLNTPHVPADAGIYAEGYLRILNRIPLGWGKWISCDKGWYKLLTELEADLAEIFPFYAINQVKEKYGTLRFYTANPDMTLECCKKFLAEANRPKFKANSMITDEEKVAMDTWYETYEPAKNAHDLTPEHIAMQEVQDALYAPYKGCGERFEARIVEAEKLSRVTCDGCGEPGVLGSYGGWYSVRCATCADLGWYELGQDNEDEEEASI